MYILGQGPGERLEGPIGGRNAIGPEANSLNFIVQPLGSQRGIGQPVLVDPKCSHLMPPSRSYDDRSFDRARAGNTTGSKYPAQALESGTLGSG